MNNVRVQTIIFAAIAFCIALAIFDGTRKYLQWRTDSKQQQEQFAADLAHEKKMQKAQIAAKRFRDQALAEERAKRIVEAENDFQAEKKGLKYDRSKLLADIELQIRTRTRYQKRLEGLLTNDLGQRISASPAAIGRFHRLYTENQHTIEDLESLKTSVPPESAIIVDEESKTVEADSYSRDIESVQMQLTVIPSVRRVETLVWSLEAEARRLEPKERLQDALNKWKELAEGDQRLSAWSAKPIADGLEFYGRYEFTSSNPQKNNPVGFFKLIIVKRNGIYFDASLQLGKKSWPAKGQVGLGTLIFKGYKSTLEASDDIAFVTYTGKLQDKALGKYLLSGTFELAKRRTKGGIVIQPGEGHFYAQTIEKSLATREPTKSPLLSGKNDAYAPGAVWTGHYTPRLPKPTSAKTPFSMKILSRVGDEFTAVLLPDRISLFNGKLGTVEHRKRNLTWSSAAENGNLIKYTATDIGRTFLVGEAAGTADGDLYKTTFRMHFTRIDEDFWEDTVVWPTSETARSDATAAYQR